MKTPRSLIGWLLVILLLSGCVVVSLNPLFTERDLISYPGLVGVWKHDQETWTFEPEGTAYKLIHQDEKDRKAIFQIRVGKLGTNVFMDIFLTELAGDPLSDFAAVQLIPGHVMAKLSLPENHLSLTLLDTDWLQGELKRNPKLIPHVLQEDRRPILTATTPELQKFAIKFAPDTNAFKNELLLERQK